MTRHHPQTFRGALHLLGELDPDTFTELTRVLGGMIAGPASVLPWSHRSTEALSLLNTLIEALPGRLGEVPARRRRVLVAALHTAVVVASVVEIGIDEPPARSLYDVPVPAPSGFADSITSVEQWLAQLNPAASGRGRPVDPEVVRRYRERYLALAGEVLEFAVWAAPDQPAIDVRLAAILDRQGDDLRRIAAILELAAGPAGARTEPQAAVARANAARLAEKIVRREETDPLSAVWWPGVGEAFVAPSFRAARMTPDARVADETWWRRLDRRDDLDLWLSGYALADDSTRVPLVLLGHPGAGKSMLMKVLAARLPAADYTVVLVPLRTVGANAPLLEQLQQALDQATNRRVQWSELADHSLGTTRVVILDGLDELLQASSNDRSGFLQEVTQFQRIEADQDRPVMVIVTSRTVVADRVDIPAGSAVLKLDDFDEQQIERWLGIWNGVNAGPIAQGAVRALPTDVALTQPELARQPLLLLILAIYSADPDAPPLADGVSGTVLYQRIFDSFTRREVLKQDPAPAAGVDAQAERKLARLCVAALAMFNRGSQSVTEEELGADLAALLGAEAPAAEEPGRRLLGEFFFVHTAEAVVLGAGTGLPARRSARRSYEFLHATFGEYLVAYRILEALRDAADRAYAVRRPGDPEGDLLFALLAHQPLAVRRSTLAFLAGLFGALEPLERHRVVRALEFLLQRYRSQEAAERYRAYQPAPVDHLRRLAAYCANLVALRVALLSPDESFGLHHFSSDPAASGSEWVSALSLWRAGLDSDGWLAMLSLLRRSGDALVSLHGADEPAAAVEATPVTADYLHARLAGDAETRTRLTMGLALHDDVVIVDGEDDAATLLGALYAGLCSKDADVPRYSTLRAGSGTGRRAMAIAGTIERLLATRQANGDEAAALLRRIAELGLLEHLDPTVAFINLCRFPEILEGVPELGDRERYPNPGLALLVARSVGPVGVDRGRRWSLLLEGLCAADPAATDLIEQLPEKVVRLVAALVRSIRDDQFANPLADNLRKMQHLGWTVAATLEEGGQ